MFETASLADVPAFRCAHATDEVRATGCTVAIAPRGATCGVDVRGGGPATRETDLLKPENMIESVHAVVLSGGSAFGLAASTGVMEELAERNIGFSVGPACVPIVTSACLFDLLVGENAHPDASLGRLAARRALDEASAPLEQGNVGAGTGASVGKLLGPDRAMKSGFGMAGARCGELSAVALVAVNALGSVCDGKGSWIAGCRADDGSIMNPDDVIAALFAAQNVGMREEPAAAAKQQPSIDDAASQPCRNTTISVVLTNARLSKAQATKAASTVHDAYARAIKPVHTLNDGDTVFVLASGDIDAPCDAVAMLATDAMQQAIVNAVTTAQSAYGLFGLAGDPSRR